MSAQPLPKFRVIYNVLPGLDGFAAPDGAQDIYFVTCKSCFVTYLVNHPGMTFDQINDWAMDGFKEPYVFIEESAIVVACFPAKCAKHGLST